MYLFEKLGKTEFYSVVCGKVNRRIARGSHERSIVNPMGKRTTFPPVTNSNSQ